MSVKRARQPVVPARTGKAETGRISVRQAKPVVNEEEDDEGENALPEQLMVRDDAGEGGLVDETDSEESEYSGLESEEDGEEEEEEEEGEGEDEDEEEEEGSDSDVLQRVGSAASGDDDEEKEEEEEEEADIFAAHAEVDAGEETESDVEEVHNTVGNIPMEWYADYPHIGYDLEGKKVMKPAGGDELDKFLDRMDNPDFLRTVYDKQNQREVKLTDEELAIIQRIQGGQFPDAKFDPYEPYVDFFTGEKMIHPLGNEPEPKRRFQPSKWEHKRIMKIVRAIRNGWIKPKGTEVEKPRFYEIWSSSDEPRPDHPMNAPAPKMKLPSHDESYNPPAEYLPTAEEIEEWENTAPEDRKRNFLPQKYGSLRLVPRYDNYIQERFERCLDLYLCPRARKTRLNIDPETLIPKLPKPRDLHPFPTFCAVVFKGHGGRVRSISVSPDGQFVASGSDDKSLRVWEIITGRCLRVFGMSEPVVAVAWNPNKNLNLIAAACGKDTILINPLLSSKENNDATDAVLARAAADNAKDEGTPGISWRKPTDTEWVQGYRVRLEHESDVNSVVWHHKGDYLASVVRNSPRSVLIHQISKRRSQAPFKKSKGDVQCVQFHPTRPFFFVATQRYVRIYNLAKQELAKKLLTGVKWVSSMDVHPGGDNVIIGAYDRRLCWFDLDLSSKPYKTLRYHDKALRAVNYHSRYPLFASASDDGSVHVFHGRVFSDLLQNPLIVPVKKLEGHSVENGLGVMDCKFHPSQPWLLSAGADHTIRLWT